MRKSWLSVHWGDYLANTGNLSMAQHGAYLLLVCHYYKTGEPIPSDRELIREICRNASDAQLAEAIEVLEEFFMRDGDVYRLEEIEKDLSRRPRRWPHGFTPERLKDNRLRGEKWAQIRMQIYARDDYTCVYCGQRGGRLECDHIIPVSRGGSNEPDNLATACYACNRAKRDRTPGEWLQ